MASALALAIPRAAAAQTGANVLVVINHASSASETIGRQYAERRGVPERNLCVLQLPLDESVNREVYDTRIEQPIWSCTANHQAQDRILYIVLTKDVPIRISGTSGRSGTIVLNPYFAGATPSTTVEPFTHRAHDIYLVTRLDSFTFQDAILTYSPNDPLALNNLAYALAVYRNIPEEALPVAHAQPSSPAKIRRSSAVRASRTITRWARTGASRWCRTCSTRSRGCSTCWVARHRLN